MGPKMRSVKRFCKSWITSSISALDLLTIVTSSTKTGTMTLIPSFSYTHTPEGYRYWMTFVDDYTDVYCSYFLKSKDQSVRAFWVFKAAAELATGYKLQVLHDDKEGGLSGREFNTDLQSCGVKRRFTMRAEPHSNGKA